MVATSVIARGLDVPDIRLVVNFNCPNHMEDYVHRIGIFPIISLTLQVEQAELVI